MATRLDMRFFEELCRARGVPMPNGWGVWMSRDDFDACMIETYQKALKDREAKHGDAA